MTESEAWQTLWRIIDHRRTSMGRSKRELYAQSLSAKTFDKMRADGVPVTRPANRRKVERALGWPEGRIDDLLVDLTNRSSLPTDEEVVTLSRVAERPTDDERLTRLEEKMDQVPIGRHGRHCRSVEN